MQERTQTAKNPYIGPVPFVRGQLLYGRESDVQLLSDLVIAKRIVLLISPSGAGKTSLIQSALLPKFEKRFDVFPIVRLDLSGAGAPTITNRYVFASLQVLDSRLPPAARKSPEALETLTLVAYFRTLEPVKDANGRARFPMLVFDQFEELFTLDRSDWLAKKEFLSQLGELLGSAGGDPEGEDTEGQDPLIPPVWALFSMREDHVAELEPFLDRIPTGLAYRYRLLPLEAAQAVEAIHAPAGESFPPDAAQALVDDLRRVYKIDAGLDNSQTMVGRFVEPLLLQISCLRLWEQIVAAQARTITVADIAASKSESKIDSALADYFGDEVAAAAAFGNIKQRVLRDFIEDKLLSRGGVRTKVLRDPGQLGKLKRALDQLIARHILRTDIAGDREWIELSHDRLVDPVCRSNREWREKKLSLLQKQAKLWSESGKPQDLLFSGEQLDQAERFAAEHPDYLVEADSEFLKESDKERIRLRAERQQQAQIAQMNRTLVKQRRALIFGIVAVVIACGSLVDLTRQLKLSEANIQRQYLDSRLKESTLLVRDENAAEGLRMLVETNQEIKHLGIQGEETSLDMALIRVLGRFPPIEARLGQHAAMVRAIAFAESGNQVISGSWDNKLGLWSTAKGGAAGTLHDGHTMKISALAYNEPAQLAVSADEGGTIVLWKVGNANASQQGQLTWRIKGPVTNKLPKIAATEPDVAARVMNVALNADGTVLAASSRDKRIALWDVSNPSQPRPLGSFGNSYHQSEIRQVAFVTAGPKKGWLVSADWDGRVGLWNVTDLASSKPAVALITEKPVAIHALAVSPNGRWIFAGDKDGDVHVWGTQAEEGSRADARIVNKQSRSRVNSMAFSNDGNTLYSVGDDSSLIRWTLPDNPTTAAQIVDEIKASRIPGWEEKLYSIAAHPTRDGVVVVGGSRSVMLVDTGRPSLLAKPIVGTGIPAQMWRGLAASVNLDVITLRAVDGQTVYLLQRVGDQYQATSAPLTFSGGVAGLAVSRSGSHFAVQTCSGEVQVSPVADWTKVNAPVGGPNRCPFRNALAFSPNGMVLAAAHGSNLKFWDKGPSQEWRAEPEKRFDKDIAAIAFNANGDALAIGGMQNWIEVWRMVGNQIGPKVASTIGNMREPVLSMAFSADDKTLVAATETPEMNAWVLPDLKAVSSIGDLHERAVDNFVLGRRDNVNAMYSADRAGQLVSCFGQLISANCTRLGRSFGRPISGMAISDDGASLVLAGPGLFLWNLKRSDMLQTVARLASEGRQ
jgi:WD40 repeat protein